MAPRSPPAIMDDVVIEILLRLPPDDDTASLARASLVCKAWRRLLADRAFLRRYRDIHGSAPFLGFLYNNFSVGVGASGPFFLRTTPPSPFPPPAPSFATPTYCRTFDCRHGRVLLYHPASYSYTVWDPITGKERCFSAPRRHHYGRLQFTAAVLCASNGCDHLHCSGGLFHVVVVAIIHPNPPGHWLYDPPAATTARASLYSSETGKWTVSATIDVHSSFSVEPAPSLLAGDAIFFTLAIGKGIIKYDLTRGVLSVINLPPQIVPNKILYTAEDGGLGVAAVDGSSLCLLSGRTDPDDGVWRWAQGRVMELDSMIPTGFGDPLTNKFYVVGFAEDTGYIFVRVNHGIFRVELKSGRMSKIGSGKLGLIFPFMRFGHINSWYYPGMLN